VGIVAAGASKLVPALPEVLVEELGIGSVVTLQAELWNRLVEKMGRAALVGSVASETVVTRRFVNRTLGHSIHQFGMTASAEMLRIVSEQVLDLTLVGQMTARALPRRIGRVDALALGHRDGRSLVTVATQLPHFLGEKIVLGRGVGIVAGLAFPVREGRMDDLSLGNLQ
jgi:hypothetical protein